MAYVNPSQQRALDRATEIMMNTDFGSEEYNKALEKRAAICEMVRFNEKIRLEDYQVSAL